LLDLNNKFLKHDYYTDIISFQSDTEPIAGDIYISIDRVKDNAEKLEVKFINELLRVISHGMLHFMGYKDKSKEDQNLMRAKEDELISLLKTATAKDNG
jgi:rRNA maturation RNase YbeY